MKSKTYVGQIAFLFHTCVMTIFSFKLNQSLKKWRMDIAFTPISFAVCTKKIWMFISSTAVWVTGSYTGSIASRGKSKLTRTKSRIWTRYLSRIFYVSGVISKFNKAIVCMYRNFTKQWKTHNLSQLINTFIERFPPKIAFIHFVCVYTFYIHDFKVVFMRKMHFFLPWKSNFKLSNKE